MQSFLSNLSLDMLRRSLLLVGRGSNDNEWDLNTKKHALCKSDQNQDCSLGAAAAVAGLARWARSLVLLAS